MLLFTGASCLSTVISVDGRSCFIFTLLFLCLSVVFVLYTYLYVYVICLPFLVGGQIVFFLASFPPGLTASKSFCGSSYSCKFLRFCLRMSPITGERSAQSRVLGSVSPSSLTILLFSTFCHAVGFIATSVYSFLESSWFSLAALVICLSLLFSLSLSFIPPDTFQTPQI